MAEFTTEERGSGEHTYTVVHWQYGDTMKCKEGEHYMIRSDRLYVALGTGLYDAWKRLATTHGFAGDVLEYQDFMKHMKAEPYFIESGRQKKLN